MKKALSLILVCVMLLGLASCGGGGKESPSGFSESDYTGFWTYEEYGWLIAIAGDGTWYGDVDYDGVEDIGGDTEFFEGKLTLLNEDGSEYTVMRMLDLDTLTDSEGDMLVPAADPSDAAAEPEDDTLSGSEPEAGSLAFIPDDLPQGLPSPLDPLTEAIEFPNVPGVTVSYPALMEGHVHGENTLSFNALNEDGTDDFFTNINFSLQSVTNFDEYMSQGHDTAKAKMQWALETLVNQMFGEYLIKYIGTDFVDGGTYWGITAYAWMDGTIFVTDCGQPVRATVELRYVGPTGYLIMAYAIGVESRINNYYGIACNMMESVTMGGDWSTAPKPRPAEAGSPISGGDPGDQGTPYYWYDEDGDVWYWNGYENEFIGFGDSYYIDDDGEGLHGLTRAGVLMCLGQELPFKACRMNMPKSGGRRASLPTVSYAGIIDIGRRRP